MSDVNWKLTEEQYKDIITKADALIGERLMGKDVQDIIIEYFTAEFPDMTAEECKMKAQAIVKSSLQFTEEMQLTDDISQKVRENIIQTIKTMDSQEALRFLETMKYILEVSTARCIQNELQDETVINLELLERELKNRIEANDSVNPAERIDKLVDEITNADTSMLIMLNGNTQLLEEINENNGKIGEAVYALSNTKVKQDIDRALVSSVVYSEARQGAIEGVSQDVDPAIVSIFVNAGIEKARVIEALTTGEIDEQEATSILYKIGGVVKFLLTVFVSMAIMYIVTATVTGMLAEMFATGIISATVCMAIGVVYGYKIMMCLTDSIVEGITDFCGFLYRKAVAPAVAFVKRLLTNKKVTGNTVVIPVK